MVCTRSQSVRAAQKAGVGNVAQKLNASKPAAAKPAKKAGAKKAVAKKAVAKKAIAKKAARKVIALDDSISESDDDMDLDDVAEKDVVEKRPKKFEDLPIELLREVGKLLDPVAFILFSVTCRHAHGAWESLAPLEGRRPVLDLNQSTVNGIGTPLSLKYLLTDWMAAQDFHYQWWANKFVSRDNMVAAMESYKAQEQVLLQNGREFSSYPRREEAIKKKNERRDEINGRIYQSNGKIEQRNRQPARRTRQRVPRDLLSPIPSPPEPAVYRYAERISEPLDHCLLFPWSDGEDDEESTEDESFDSDSSDSEESTTDEIPSTTAKENLPAQLSPKERWIQLSIISLFKPTNQGYDAQKALPAPTPSTQTLKPADAETVCQLCGAEFGLMLPEEIEEHDQVCDPYSSIEWKKLLKL